MNDEDLMCAQRELRLSLLDTPGRIHWRPARDLAAHLLLHLDSPNECLNIATDWLREAFDADRVDCGFGRPDDALFRPQAEALRRGRNVPSVIGIEMNTADWGLQALWRARGVTVLRDFELERLLSQRNRAELLRMGTRVKMAAPIMDHAGPLALMCVDWLDICEPAHDERQARFEEVAAVVLGPVMSASLRIAGRMRRESCPPQHEEVPMLLNMLSPAERIVVRLAVNGLSYKEIARQLNRSFSTVDHQLRSARSKLGVSSTARLVNLMSSLRSH